jgi:hypothetical protein
MASLQDFLGLATTLVVLGVIVAGVMKIFQMASDMQELKEIAKDIRRNTQNASSPIPAASSAYAPPGYAPPDYAPPAPGVPTAEELVRAVHAQDFRGDKFPL